MSRTTEFFRSRHGWQRHPAIFVISAFLAVFLLLVCGACGPSKRLYQEAESLQRSDRLEEALKLADRGLAASRGNPSWFHRFRILKAELLVMEHLPKQALDLLE